MIGHSTRSPVGRERLTMNRAEFIKALGLGAAGIGAGWAYPGGAAVGAPAAGPAQEVEVYPTGVFPYDVEEVRAAVNGGLGPSGTLYAGGGVVRLKARNASGTPTYFHFGDGATRGSVSIERDVTILGESFAPTPMAFPNNGDPGPDYVPDRTVVYGGKRPFGCDRTNVVATRLTVRNVYFAYPTLAAVQVHKSAGLEVSNCVICDVARGQTSIPTLIVAVGVEATTLSNPAPLDLAGELRVFNNRIRRAIEPPLPAGLPVASSGIVVQYASMDAQIFANQIELFEFVGIGVDSNAGSVVAAANEIAGCGWGANSLSAGVGVRRNSAPVVIERNDIRCDHPSVPSRPKNGISVGASNVVLRQNNIAGKVASMGIWLTVYKPPGAVYYYALDNTVTGNRLTALEAGIAQAAIDPGCHANRLTSNEYGSVVATSAAGLVVASNDNRLVNEHFLGSYRGKAGVPPQPCIWLKAGTVGNAVTALKYQDGPQGKDVCDQVADEGANFVEGYQRCH